MKNPSLYPYWKVPGGNYWILYKELADRQSHTLIAGATGSGKSVCLNGIMQYILVSQSPVDATFVLIDPKKVELIDYKDIPHTMMYADEPESIIKALERVVNEIKFRYEAMQERHMKMYDGPILYVIIDELADITLTMTDEALPLLTRIAQIGRAANVRLIACSQNILAKTIPTVLKCNFNTILGLRTATRQHSRYLIEAPGCEALPNPKVAGTAFGYLRDGADLTKRQLYMFPESELKALINYWKHPVSMVG